MRETERLISQDAIRALLTPIQLDCVFRISNGEYFEEASLSLHKHVRMVEQQLAVAKRNLGCRTTFQLIAVVVRSGILEESWERLRREKLRKPVMPARLQPKEKAL